MPSRAFAIECALVAIESESAAIDSAALEVALCALIGVGLSFFVLVKCLRQQQGYLKFQFSMIEMHSSVFCCAQRTGKTQDGKSHLFRSWIGNPTLKKNLIMGSQVAKVCLTLPLSSHPCCSYKKRVFGQLSRKKGITKYRKYFRSGVKSHKSTCQELYQKDRELHKVWDSLPWKERDRVM